MGKIVAWWSAGVTSAVACKMALELYDNVELYYIHIASAHKDNVRFKKDCEDWYGSKINLISSKDFKDQFDVIYKTKAVNTPYGAPCTKKLKKDVRFCLEKEIDIERQVFGFEFQKKEINRAIRFGQQYPHTNPLFPLIEKGLTKENCASILLNNKIELPEMYRLGYPNNNCIGCVKGGQGYWNKIRKDFPDTFNKMAKAERDVGYSCMKKYFLDELPIDAGRSKKEIFPSCGILCEVEFADMPHVDLDFILNGSKSIYDAIRK